MKSSLLAAITSIALKDKNFIVLTGDLGFNLFEPFINSFPKQFYNIGIAEQTMAGIAAGLAKDNKHVLFYSIGNFSTLRCLEQIRNDICYHDLNVTIISQGGGFNYGGFGVTHHTTEDLAIMRAIPGMTVVAPSSKQDAFSAIDQAYKHGGATYIRLENTKTDKFNERNLIIGKSNKLRDGDDITLFGIGGILEEAIKASEILSQHGIALKVVDIHTLAPIDTMTIIEEASRSRYIFTLEEHVEHGGLFGAIAEVLVKEGVPAKITAFALPNRFASIIGDQMFLRKHFKIDSNAIIEKALSLNIKPNQ